MLDLVIAQITNTSTAIIRTDQNGKKGMKAKLATALSEAKVIARIAAARLPEKR
jgi:hypothetical protein